MQDVTNNKRNRSSKPTTRASTVEKKGNGTTEQESTAKAQAATTAVSTRSKASANKPEEIKKPSRRSSRVAANRNRTHKAPVFERPANYIVNSSYQYSGKFDDVDERDKDDPFSATEYVEDLYCYHRERELIISATPNYLMRQPHINEKMRKILVDWLVEVHRKFKMVPDSLYLTVNIIDRYLEIEEVSRSDLQLLGVTAFLIAAKYEEIYPPDLTDLVYICDRAYTRQDVSC
mgnify:CR=1 FL=1